MEENVKVKIRYNKIVEMEEEVEIPKKDFDILTKEKNEESGELFFKYEKKFIFEEFDKRFGKDFYQDETFEMLNITY